MGVQMQKCKLYPKGSANMFQDPAADKVRLTQALDDKTVIAVHRAIGDGGTPRRRNVSGMYKPMRYYEDLISGPQ